MMTGNAKRHLTCLATSYRLSDLEYLPTFYEPQEVF